MQDTSPVILQVSSDSAEYKFYYFTVYVHNTLAQTDPDFKVETFSDFFERDEYIRSIKEMAQKFDGTVRKVVSFTVLNVATLLSYMDKISKALLSNVNNQLTVALKKSIPDLDDHWDQKYLSDAQGTFDQFKSVFQQIPGFQLLLDRITKNSL